MSTTIKSAVSERTLRVMNEPFSLSGRVGVVVEDADEAISTGIEVRTADLLAAIEAEGIGIVVPGTLPEVRVEGDHPDEVMVELRRYYRLARDADLALVREIIAAHRHFDANPPAPQVDEADVEALVALLPEIDEARRPEYYARALLLSGRVTVTR